MAVAPKLPVISEAATHAKALTGGRVMAETRKLPVFIRRALLDIRRRSCEAARLGEDDGCGSQAPSLYPTGAVRYPSPVM